MPSAVSHPCHNNHHFTPDVNRVGEVVWHVVCLFVYFVVNKFLSYEHMVFSYPPPNSSRAVLHAKKGLTSTIPR